MLVESGSYPDLQAELDYTRPLCEQMLARRLSDDAYGHRQRVLLERVVGKG